jgi:Zn-dependent peptidase ImmA (M78 family)/transcriptional regulator with XRE-family HTH domain
MPAVNPEILKWARETAGLSLAKAAHAVGIKDARGLTGAERLAAIESGEKEPSRPLLLKMAKKYRRPLVVFYLQAPPEKGDRGEDFRRAPGAPPPAEDATVDALIRDIRSRHSLIRSLMEDEEAQALQFIGSAKVEHGAPALVTNITKRLSFDLDKFRRQRSAGDAFDYLRSKIEGAGIFVLLAGNLGSYHTNISTKVFRGYAIADPLSPLIVINDQDARAAWSFTALHETAHLWLGSTGISGSPSVDIRIESFCNDVAGEILLPRNELQEISSIDSYPYEEIVAKVTHFAEARMISRSMVAYKLYRLNIISEMKWRKLVSQYDEEWKEWHDTRKSSHTKKGEEEGGPNYYVVRRHRLGPALLMLVSRALNEGLITYTKAGKVLGVKPTNVAPLLSEFSYQGDT